MSEFEYNLQLLALNKLNIEDIGNCAIEAKTDDEIYFYVVIKTSLGTSSIFICGPVVPDIALLPSGFCCSLNKFKYNENKLIQEISKCLNGLTFKKKHISEARVISEQEAVEQFRDLGEYITRCNTGEVY